MAAAAAAAATAAGAPKTQPGLAPNPPSGKKTEAEQERWAAVLGLPCELTVDLELPGFTIADLLKLRAGSVLDGHWRLGQDVPLRLNGTLIGWCEFEVVKQNLAVRLTEAA